jgi:SAM-dependent methyltransferase
MTELDLLVDLHKYSERQGPGSKEETIKALELMDVADQKHLKIADMGCGTGGQTTTLAQHIDGKITAVDLFSEFLVELNLRAKKLGIHDKIITLQTSMDRLPFENEFFDIIWSEGAIYNMGFEKGIKKWREYLKPEGYLAVSEISWIGDSRPVEIEDYWMKAYPEIDTASNKIKILEDNGFSLAGYFYLKQDSWIENYYKPLENSFSTFLERHHNSAAARKVVKEHKEEIEMYTRFKEYYSYGFYVAKKKDY